ncbi:hypothetical protein LR48_Vigan11g076800 [Vigna angularis]|uniref:Uncharacterized protein n=1 Tax=Phaseolus angularis TaxID=3914 RepID=A0A0L9VRN8_PHAAN|nr:hypothetical protein LR48_Vigan11g076800 [Vigna angularis]
MYFERTLDRGASVIDFEDSVFVVFRFEWLGLSTDGENINFKEEMGNIQCVKYIASDGLKKGKGTTNVYVDGCVYMPQVWFFEHFVPPEGPINKFPRILHWMNSSVGDKFVKRCMESGLVVDDDYVDVGASTKDKKEYRPTPTRKDGQPRPNKIQKRNRRETFMRTLEEQEFLIEELKRRVAGLEAQLAEEKAKRQNKYHGGESVPRTKPSMNTGFVSPTDIDTNQQALKTYVRVGSRRRYKGRALRTPYTGAVVLRIKNE